MAAYAERDAKPAPVTRRRFLELSGKLMALSALPITSPTWAWGQSTRFDSQAGRWSDPATWGGSVPGPDDVATVSGTVFLDMDATVAGVTIEPTGVLIFSPRSSRVLQSSGNVEVRGRLTMHPRNGRVVHRLVFIDVDESKFVGGGEEVLATDVGLWVTQDGILDLSGRERLPWTRALGDVPAGSTVITLQQDPIGWHVGDELVVVPTMSPAEPDHALAYDSATVAAINGRTITLSAPTIYDHPEVPVAEGVVMGAEVLNLTRNVSIEGTQAGRAHVWVGASVPQMIRYATMRYMGPRQQGQGGDSTDPVLGRYGLHFHMAGGGTGGTQILGVVVRDGGNHAFVPHMSDGITFTECISHNTFEGAFWWDDGDMTNDLVWDRCVASLVNSDPPNRGFDLCGFKLGVGDSSVMTSCVAVGVQGHNSAAGLRWFTEGGMEGSWSVTGCVAHNNAQHGLRVWQNTKMVHESTGFIAYHNGGAGISQGAYRNAYQFVAPIIYGNALCAIDLDAVSSYSGEGTQLTFLNAVCDAAGLSDFAVQTGTHVLAPAAPTIFRGCSFAGALVAAFAVLDASSADPDIIDLVDCTFDGNEFWLDSSINASSLLHLSDETHGNIYLRRFDQYGTLDPSWNARVASH